MTSRLTLLLFLFLFQSVQAQDLDTVTLYGKVVDQNGAVVPGAKVQARTRTVSTDDNGLYRLIQLEPGSYSIRVSCPGFATQEFTHIGTTSGQSLHLDVTLLPASLVVEPVVVTTTETPVVDTKRTVVGATLTARETALLPIASRSV